MKLRDLMTLANDVEMVVHDDCDCLEANGDALDLFKMLSDWWINSTVQSYEVLGNTMTVHVKAGMENE